MKLEKLGLVKTEAKVKKIASKVDGLHIDMAYPPNGFESATQPSADGPFFFYLIKIPRQKWRNSSLGMVVDDSEVTKYTNSFRPEERLLLAEHSAAHNQPIKSDREANEKFFALDHFRSLHAERSAIRIGDMYPKDCKENSYIHDVYIWDAVSHVCRSHTMPVEELLLNSTYSPEHALGNGHTVNLIYISCLLRLSDICHFSRDRAFPYFIRSIDFNSEYSKSIWQHYSDVRDTIPCLDDTIKIYADCESVYNHRAIISHSGAIQRELIDCHRLLAEKKSAHKLRWKYIDTSNVKPSSTISQSKNYIYGDSCFTLNTAKIIQLLMGNKIYSNELFAVRECIQNSSDAIAAFMKKVYSSDNVIVIDYKHAEQYLDIFDTGTGMDMEIINNNFLSVGESSFWYTKRAVEEWGAFTRHGSIIADHGIGALSYFLISKKLEIYSIYHRSSEPCHVQIDSVSDGVIFRKTQIEEFPTYSLQDNSLPSPWELKHGTCIRMHLKNSLSPADLLFFCAKHLLRMPYQIRLIVEGTSYDIKQRWEHGFLEEDRRYSSSMSESETNLADQYSRLYDEQRNFYDGPPCCPTKEECAVKGDGLDYIVSLRTEQYSFNQRIRISQNGILIEHADSFLAHVENVELLNLFFLDVNLAGDKSLQLDAERTRIIRNDYNLQIVNKLISRAIGSYFSIVSSLEHTMFFPCGNIYYHGLEDVALASQDDSSYVSYNEYIANAIESKNPALSAGYTLEQRRRMEQLIIDNIEQMNSAKWFCVGVSRNEPVSVNDITQDGELNEILVIKQKPSKAKRKRVFNEIKAKSVNIEKLVYLPGHKNAFCFPLRYKFEFTPQFENDQFRILRITSKCSQLMHVKNRSFFNVYSKR